MSIFLSLALSLGAPSDSIPARAAQRIVLAPRALTSFGAAELDGWLYVYGGYAGAKHEYCAEDQARQFWRFNLRDRATWELIGEVDALQSVALVAHDGALVRAGGMRALNGRAEKQELVSSADVVRFDPLTRVWTPLASLPAPRSSHAAAVLGSELYIAGGWRLDRSEPARWHEDMLALDLGDPTASWRAMPVPFKRRGLALAAHAGRLYAIGGMDEAETTLPDVHVFDPASGSWSAAPELPAQGFGVAACVERERLFASDASGAVWRLDGDAWQRAATLTWPRMFHQLVASDAGELLALGGASRSARVKPLEFVALDASEPRLSYAEVPAPGAARNRQAWFLRGSTLYAFGGNNAAGQHDFTPENFTGEGWSFDLDAWSWRARAALPVARQSLETFELAGACVALGGFGFDGARLRTHAEAFTYDIANDRWSPAGALTPEGRTQFALAEHDGALWLFGGLDYEKGRGPDGDFVHPLSVLSRAIDAPVAKAFEPTGVSLPGARRAFAGAELDGRMYLVGGLREGFESVPEVDVFEFATRTWSTAASPAHTRIGGQLIALDGALYLVGGNSRDASGASGPDRTIERFDPDSQSWTTLPVELPFAPQHIRAFAWRGQILVVSTHDALQPTLRIALIAPGVTERP